MLELRSMASTVLFFGKTGNLQLHPPHQRVFATVVLTELLVQARLYDREVEVPHGSSDFVCIDIDGFELRSYCSGGPVEWLWPFRPSCRDRTAE